ncbi:DMT family transporter [uncultured Limimaricola sp.]|uniref:DMT family transporter n=1 Tax=uncultured Limimaricola sp. TaxID=2211667 RepID=UPI0030F603D5
MQDHATDIATAGGTASAAAIGMAATAAALAATDAALVRAVAQEMHPFAIGFFRSAFGLAFLAPWIIARGGLGLSRYRGLHLLRAAIKLLSLVAFYAAFASAELADATAVMFTAPLFLTLGAWIWLGERLDALRIFGIATGFAGALILIAPGGGSASPALLYALSGAALIAVAQLMLKAMSAHDDTGTLVAWNLVVTVPLAAIPAALVWTTPSVEVLGLLALQGVLGAANMALMTRAFGLADASLLAPVDFLRLPMVAALGYLAFGESPGLATWIGAAVILTGTLVVTAGGRLKTHRAGLPAQRR